MLLKTFPSLRLLEFEKPLLRLHYLLFNFHLPFEQASIERFEKAIYMIRLYEIDIALSYQSQLDLTNHIFNLN